MLKTAITLLCLAVLSVVAAHMWWSSRILVPMDQVWPQGAEHWRSPAFTVNLENAYQLNIHTAHLSQATRSCWDHASTANQPVACGELLSRAPIDVAVFRTDRNGHTLSKIAFKRDDPGFSRYDRDDYQYSLGYFFGQAGQSYYVDLTARIPPETVANLQPRIRVALHRGGIFERTVGLWLFDFGCGVVGFVSLCAILGIGISGRRQRRQNRPLPANDLRRAI